KACVADIDALFWESKPVPSHNVRVIDDNQRLPNDANSGTKTGRFAACFVAFRRHPARINPAKSARKPNPPGRATPLPNSAAYQTTPTHGPGGERRMELHPHPLARGRRHQVRAAVRPPRLLPTEPMPGHADARAASPRDFASLRTTPIWRHASSQRPSVP